MIRPILKYGAPELKKKCIPVSDFDERLKTLVQDLLETMYGARGIGLAAPQVGINIRLTVIDVTGGEEQGHQLILVNPEITDRQGIQKEEEGCLSIPGFTAEVERPSKIRLFTRNLQGREVEMEAEELLACVICHEIDHLDGILYLDRISALKRDLIKRKIRKLIKSGDWK